MAVLFRAKHKSGYWVDSPLKPVTFPAGEAHIHVPDTFKVSDYTHHLADVRGHDPLDLFMVSMWADVLTTLRVEKWKEFGITVSLPYLPGARADRGLPQGASIYAEFINGWLADQIITIDPHSPVMPDLINNLTVFPVERVIKHYIQDGSSDIRPQPYVGVIAPDKGAVKRAQGAATVMGVPLYTAEKVRDFETGKLSGFRMIDELPAEGKLLIVDDICDGGGTFVGLAKAINIGHERLDLWVTHGIFSKGFDSLEDYFGTIHTTNSYFRGWKNADTEVALADCTIKIHDITHYLYGEIK